MGAFLRAHFFLWAHFFLMGDLTFFCNVFDLFLQFFRRWRTIFRFFCWRPSSAHFFFIFGFAHFLKMGGFWAVFERPFFRPFFFPALHLTSLLSTSLPCSRLTKKVQSRAWKCSRGPVCAVESEKVHSRVWKCTWEHGSAVEKRSAVEQWKFWLFSGTKNHYIFQHFLTLDCTVESAVESLELQ